MELLNGDTQFGVVFLRTAIMFLVALVIVRLMGNRTIGELTPFDYVVLVGIGDIVANVALDTEMAMLDGVEALAMLLVLCFLLSWISLKNIRLRHLIEGSPIQLIKDGEILRDNLGKAHFNHDDLRQELHKLGMDIGDVKDIKEGWLEGCGYFTVVLEKGLKPVSIRDMENILRRGVQPGEISTTVISQATLEELIGKVDHLVQVVKRMEMEKVSGKHQEKSSD